MSAERNIEKAAKVLVPEELYRKLFPDGTLDPVSEYILEQNSDDVVQILIDAGILVEEGNIDITFVPAPGISKNSTMREVKYMEVHRNINGHIVDVLTDSKIVQWSPDRRN